MISRWHGEDRLGAGELEQLIEYSRREARACGDRLLGIRSAGGGLVAISKLRGDGAVAQVDDVYTTPEVRGQGFGRAVVMRAAELARDAGHDLILITADDEGLAKGSVREDRVPATRQDVAVPPGLTPAAGPHEGRSGPRTSATWARERV